MIDSTEGSGPSDSAPQLTQPQLLVMARGFSCVFWGLLFALLLFFSNASVEIFSVLRTPAYIAGSSLACWGLCVLRSAGGPSAAWGRRSGVALFLVALHLYFAPFLTWWQAMPYISFLLINWLCFMLAGMLSLFYISLLATEIEHRLAIKKSHFDPGMAPVSVWLLMIVPFFVVIGPPIVTSYLRKTSLYFELSLAIDSIPVWAYALFLLPCAFTLAACWTARYHCYRKFLAAE